MLQMNYHGADFHRASEVSLLGYFDVVQKQETEFTYTFENFFHPFVEDLKEKLNQESLTGLLDAKFHKSLAKPFFAVYYQALVGELVKVDSYPKEIDLREGGPYANYNWELLFHIPLTVAVHLSKNQRFAEAQRWFHYIFDPTCNDLSEEPPQRFWKFLRFREGGDLTQIDEVLALMSKPTEEGTPEHALKLTILEGYNAILKNPFQPHAVARTRHVAYQYCVVMKYLDNLIAWGDSLFRQDTIESINEATQRYVLAANILGERPQRLPARGTVRARTFAELKKQQLDPLGNVAVTLEGQFPLSAGAPAEGGADGGAASPLFGIGRTLYFCVPVNDKLLGYWDTVGDRLFKIRHCMNIEGVVRQLALFDPPLDPGMLVKAAAAGINIGSLVSGLNQPVSPVRSPLLIQKALELAGEVRSLGAALLSALEKGDSERLALLRQGHEAKIQQMQLEVRFLQWKQAREATESLLRGRASALERYSYYLRLLGLSRDAAVPDTLTLPHSAKPDDPPALTAENFDEVYSSLVAQFDRQVPSPQFPDYKLAEGNSPASLSGATGQGNLYLNQNESAELNSHLPTARDTRLASTILDTVASVLAMIPDFDVDLHFWGLGGHSEIFGGVKLSTVSKIAAEILRTVSTYEQDQAGIAARTAGYERRADDWILQCRLAARELMQSGRQIVASLIAEQVAQHEYQTLQKQIEQTQEVDRFLNEKFTNQELYAWMQGEIARLYYEYYRFAFDAARKAERAMKQELMRPELDAADFVKFNYWDAGRKGLLAGEALYLDVKRMELAYHENNRREYELTKHVSLRQLDPLALLNLKVSGRCEVTVPEWLYDRDCPGHYLRRIKTVALSLPSVVGPYAGVHCKLTLLRSSVRKSAVLTEGEYNRGDDDGRFVDYFGGGQSVVTTSGTNDSGLFEVNLHDERFLPFEGAGAVSSWRLELPHEFRAFDYSTIADAILHVRYTAREGGSVLGKEATATLRELVSDAGTSSLALLLSLREDFPTEWSKFAHGSESLTLTVRKNHFPYMAQQESLNVHALELCEFKGDAIEKRALPVPKDMNDGLNGASQSAKLTVERSILKPTATQVFLIVRYAF
jgi:hypothetical protein